MDSFDDQFWELRFRTAAGFTQHGLESLAGAHGQQNTIDSVCLLMWCASVDGHHAGVRLLDCNRSRNRLREIYIEKMETQESYVAFSLYICIYMSLCLIHHYHNFQVEESYMYIYIYKLRPKPFQFYNDQPFNLELEQQTCYDKEIPFAISISVWER